MGPSPAAIRLEQNSAAFAVFTLLNSANFGSIGFPLRQFVKEESKSGAILRI
jgi:hypothetical protein